MTPAETIRAAIAVCEARSDAACDAATDDFWRRLAGSLRKSLTMLENDV